VLGRTIRIVGYGRIGREGAKRAAGIKCRVLATNPPTAAWSPTPRPPKPSSPSPNSIACCPFATRSSSHGLSAGGRWIQTFGSSREGLPYRISVVCQLRPREAPDFFFRRRDARDPFGAQVLFVKAGTTPHKVAVHSMEPMMSQIKPRVELSRPARHATA
jgi:hypothetical protein